MTRRAPATRQNPPVTLVLDNFHLLTDPAVLDGLDYVLRNTGAGLRLVMSARTDPPLPLHRYRLAGQLTEIRASDLAFTVAEAGLLLARHGQIMPADSLKRLTQRTEGWAAGLRLAAIRLPAPPGVPGQALGLAAGPLSRREQEVLRHVSRLLSTAGSPARCTSASTPSRRTSLTLTERWRPPAAPRRSAAAAGLS
jgi:hypothetical protein